MTHTDDPIHPFTYLEKDYFGDTFQQINGGITKREYFAAMALQGLVSKMSDTTPLSIVARDAVDAADALIEALNTTTK